MGLCDHKSLVLSCLFVLNSTNTFEIYPNFECTELDSSVSSLELSSAALSVSNQRYSPAGQTGQTTLEQDFHSEVVLTSDWKLSERSLTSDWKLSERSQNNFREEVVLTSQESTMKDVKLVQIMNVIVMNN